MKYLKPIAKTVALVGFFVFAHFWTAKHPMSNATISFYICLLMFLVSYAIVLATRND